MKSRIGSSGVHERFNAHEAVVPRPEDMGLKKRWTRGAVDEE
jgi:hypothetical protein